MHCTKSSSLSGSRSLDQRHPASHIFLQLAQHPGTLASSTPRIPQSRQEDLESDHQGIKDITDSSPRPGSNTNDSPDWPAGGASHSLALVFRTSWRFSECEPPPFPRFPHCRCHFQSSNRRVGASMDAKIHESMMRRDGLTMDALGRGETSDKWTCVASLVPFSFRIRLFAQLRIRNGCRRPPC